MLISVFRSNKPTVLVVLPIVAGLIWVFAIISPITLVSNYQDSMPLYKLFIWLMGELYILTIVFAIILLVAQSIILNNIVIKHQILNRSNYLPSLLYIIIMSCCPALLTLHPVLFANFFLIFAINSILSVYREEEVFSMLFDAGLLIGIASLFYFPAVIVFPFVLTGLIILRPFAWREWVIPIMGFLVPWLFVIVYYFWFDMIDSFWNESIVSPIINDSIKSFPQEAKTTAIYPYYFLIGFAIIIILLSSVKLYFDLKTNTVQVKKYLSVLIWFLLLSLISVLIAPSFSINYFAFIAIPLSIYGSNYFLSPRIRWLSEVVFSFFIGAVVYVHLTNL